MNIGLFGDSYIDTVWHRHQNPTIPPGRKMWAQRLLEELNAPYICSGLGGTSQYYAIAEWKKYSALVNFDVAIFTFTWPHRIYTTNINEQVVTARIEGRDIGQLINNEKEIQNALDLYYQHLYNKEERDFEFELMVKWILELPSQFPDTKFIFLPNTVHSQEIAKKYFTQGILVDFAFEQLSLAEGERVGVAPYIMDRTGHLSDHAHEKVKNMIKHIILNEKNTIYQIDYSTFELLEIYKDYYND